MIDVCNVSCLHFDLLSDPSRYDYEDIYISKHIMCIYNDTQI